MQKWPSWRYGPNGAAEIFNSEDDVPKGWHDHPSKIITPESTGSKPITPTINKIPASETGGAPIDVSNPAGDDAAAAALRASAGDVSSTLDTDGQAWDGEVNTPDQAKDSDGRWTMIEGKDRPEPKPGYPVADPQPLKPDPKAKKAPKVGPGKVKKPLLDL